MATSANKRDCEMWGHTAGMRWQSERMPIIGSSHCRSSTSRLAEGTKTTFSREHISFKIRLPFLAPDVWGFNKMSPLCAPRNLQLWANDRSLFIVTSSSRTSAHLVRFLYPLRFNRTCVREINITSPTISLNWVKFGAEPGFYHKPMQIGQKFLTPPRF